MAQARKPAQARKQPAQAKARTKVEVRIGVLYHDGKAYPRGSVVEMDAAEAKTLTDRGEAGEPGGLAAEEKAEEDAEASRPRCSNCGRILRDAMGDPCPSCAQALAPPLADLDDYYGLEYAFPDFR